MRENGIRRNEVSSNQKKGRKNREGRMTRMRGKKSTRIEIDKKGGRKSPYHHPLLSPLTPSSSSFPPSIPHPPPSLTAKLFRATSAACLIKFSFLQITIRKRATLLNHITTTSYKTVYLLLCREKEMCKEKQRQHT